MKKITKILCLSLVLVMMLSSISFAAGAISQTEASEFEYAADFLNSLGLFKGTDNGYELEREPNRTEAAVMLVRLLGKEAEAQAYTGTHPFNDVPEWADRYIAYMYGNGLTKGVSDNTFGAAAACEGKMYITFVLRALGYDDSKGDFSYDDSISFAIFQGLITADYASRLSGQKFVRGDLALISYWALFTGLENGSDMLLGKLIDEKAVPLDVAQKYYDIYLAELMIDFGFYMNYKDSSFDYKTIQTIGYAASGYGSATLTIETESKGTDIFTNPRIATTQTITSAYGKDVYQMYVVDGYSYVSYPDGSKIKSAYDADDGDDTGSTTTSEYTTFFDDYKNVAISESGNKTTITATMSDSVAKERCVEFLSWFESDFESLTSADYVIALRACTDTYTINDEGYIEELTETLNFEYMILADGIRYTISSYEVATFSSLGTAVTVTIPSLTGYTAE